MSIAREVFEERAAIRQNDGGAPLEEAEAMALGDVAIEFGWVEAVAMAAAPSIHVSIHG
ncbi:MAG TPA: hypothetical protein VFP33_06905 [Gallionella sp.]|nr:hypothetical protein [Gallionella sp.]